MFKCLLKTWRLILLFVLLALLSCQSSPPVAQADGNAPDSVKIKIKQKLAEKRKLDNLRAELIRGRLGRAISKYKPVIKKYSKRYGFDWRLITAQIVQESGFRTKARSRVGAVGLMQIMPYTASELSREIDKEYILKSPRENITAGIYHLKKQFRYFPDANREDRTKLALASYNCGVGRVFDAQDIARYYKRPANQWNHVKPYLSMLKKSDWQLHLQVWPNGKPRFGYFYGYNETINYVENIYALYQMYRKIM